MGLGDGVAGPIYGAYTSMVYFMSLPGGWLADRLLGQRRAVVYGGILIAAGHYSLAIPLRRPSISAWCSSCSAPASSNRTSA